MPLPDRSLDDRSFQDLVDEAKKKIPLYCPEWTDHNVSDPGVTLIELFAWMVDLLLYRVNQVPRKHHVRLLELLGIQLEAPQAATVPLTFYLSAPQREPVTIPRGTAVSTSQAGGSTAVVFTTDDDLVMRPPQLTRLVTRHRARAGTMEYEELALERLEREFTPFSTDSPQVGEALFLGFDESLDHHYVGLDMECVRAGGRNIIPESPPLSWQAWTEVGWVEVDVEEDGTGGMSWSGQVKLHVPQMARRDVSGREAYWLRCELVEVREGQRPYATSPIVRGVEAVTWGGTVRAIHATEVVNEPLGRSDGSPGQVFHVEHTPLLPRQEGERIEIWDGDMENWEPWDEVPNFGESGPEDPVYVCDSVTGEIRFGPALRLRDGSVRRYGAIPPRGVDVRFSRYRYGGGIEGNLRARVLTELKSALAYVDHVTNRAPAQGGLDEETLEEAMFRAQNLMRTRYRAVTAEDYEYLTLHAFRGEVARVRCLQVSVGEGGGGSPSPGYVYLIVVPDLPEEQAAGYIPLASLALSEGLYRRIVEYLDKRRLLTTRLEVRAAGYRRVRVEAEVVARPGVDEARLEEDIIAALERFVNPLCGGVEGKGWPFGRELYLSDLYACIQQVEGLLSVRNVDIFWVDEDDTPHRADTKIELMAHEVLVSDVHDVTITFE
ncbi:MAG: putative baseplate assembly protein [Anaerolineales bacterium]